MAIPKINFIADQIKYDAEAHFLQVFSSIFPKSSSQTLHSGPV